MNMLAITLQVNILALAGMCAFSFGLGYWLRSSFIRKCRKKINDLEREMLRDNARILELEKEKADLLRATVSRREA
jgi:hypothetical protein